VKIHTGDGSVTYKPWMASVDIDTGDGSITVEGAKATSGCIPVTDARGADLDGRVDANSGDGHIRSTGAWTR